MKKLSDHIESQAYRGQDLNCCEAILYGAQEVYGLGLDKNALRLAAGFGGGMGIESTCGALTGSVMVLGRMFTRDRGHESPRVKELCVEFMEAYRRQMGDLDCAPLKEKYRTEELKCHRVILEAARILERIVEREEAGTGAR